MVIISNPQENLFLDHRKIKVVDYKTQGTFDILFENLKFQIDDIDNPFGSVFKVKSNTSLVSGYAYVFSLKKGFYIKLSLKNNAHKKESINMYISSSSFMWDDVREGWIIDKDKILVINNISSRDSSSLRVEINPLESKKITILYGSRDYIDSILNNLEHEGIHPYILVNDNDKQSRKYVSCMYDIINNFTIKTDNIHLNSLLNICKSMIASSIKEKEKNKICYAEIGEDMTRQILFSLILLELGGHEIVEKFIEELSKKIHKNRGIYNYAFMFLLKSYSKFSHKEEKIEKFLDYLTKIKIESKDEYILFEHLYKEDYQTKLKVIDFLSKDENLLKDPLSIYLLVKIYLKDLPESVRDYVILKLTKEKHSYTHLLSRLEINDYDTLKNYLLFYNDIFFATIIFMKYFKEIIKVEVNNILNKIHLEFENKHLYEKKILYHGLSYENINLNIIYDKERKKIEIECDEKMKDYNLEINIPSEEYEIYLNHKKLPHLHKDNIIVRI